MIGKEKLLESLHTVISESKADHTEAVFVGTDSSLTRFANNYIHQNVAESDNKTYIRVTLDSQIGVAATNALSSVDLKRALRHATQIAKNQKPNPHFKGIPGTATYADIPTFDERTARMTPRQRANKLKTIFKQAANKNMNLAGSFSSGGGEIAVVNTNGVEAYQPLTAAALNVIAMTDTSSGFAQGLSRKVSDIDVRAIGRRAITRAYRCRNPKEAEPGDYEVVLEPAAVAALVEWLSYIGFGSKAFQEGTSFLSNKLGEKITGDHITIYDDPLNPDGMAMPFDFEGVPKQQVKFLSHGIAEGVAYDTLSAAKGNTSSTGHALTPDYSGEGGISLNVVVDNGHDSVEDLISGVDNGLLVTRFHYINGYLDTPNALLTGMTRDGLMRIKNGKLRGGVKNLRFTDSMLRVFNDIRGLTEEWELVSSWWDALGCIKAPGMRIGSFKFSGKTDF